MTNLKKWEVLDSEMVLDHKWYKVRRDTVKLPDGLVLDDYFVSVRPNVVVVFALTDNNEVLLVRQYKHGAGKILTELPAGVIESGNESAAEAARRELFEETGYEVQEISEVGVLHANPTKNTNQVHVFFASQIEKKGEQNLDQTENIDILKVPLEEINTLVQEGLIAVPESIAAIYMVLTKIELK